MRLYSDKFWDNGMIPPKYTWAGEDINPSFIIKDIPEEAQSLVFIVDDPASLRGTFTHWVVYDMPVTPYIPENSVPGTVGMNDFKNAYYGGPCHPIGVHRYHFKIYALDTKLNLPGGRTKTQVEKAMWPHVIAQDEIIGLFTTESRQPVAANH